MNILTRRTTLLACAILPLALLLAGCNDKIPKTDSVSARPPDVDNTGKNVRDRDGATLTPLDQGMSAADQETTQKIRKALVIDSSGFSATAKNVKIMTVNGKVTLRGPVKSDAEKAGIVTIARSVAGDNNVDDQLEVKSSP